MFFRLMSKLNTIQKQEVVVKFYPNQCFFILINISKNSEYLEQYKQ